MRIYLFPIIFVCLFYSISASGNNKETDKFYCDSIDTEIKQLYLGGLLDQYSTWEKVNKLLPTIKEKDCSCLPSVYNIIGFYHYCKNDLVNAKKILIQGEAIFKEKNIVSKESAKNQLFLGLVYILDLNYDTAIFYLTRSKKISEEINDYYSVADANLNIGLSLLESQKYEAAEQMLESVYEISKNFESKEIKGYSLQNLAQVKIKLKDYESALQLARKAEIVWKNINHHKGLYFIYNIFSNIYKELNQREKELEYLHQALLHRESISVAVKNNSIYFSLGLAYQSINQPEKATFYFEKSIESGSILQEEEFKLAVNNLLTLYNNKGHIEKYRKLFDNILEFSDLKRNDTAIESEKWIDSENSLEIKTAENIDLKHSYQKSEKKSKSLSLIAVFLFCVLLLSGISAVILYWVNKRRKKLLNKIQSQNLQLFQINTKLEESSKIIAQQNNQLEAKNEELKSFAYVASHDLKSPIQTIISFTQLLKSKLKTEDEDVKKFLQIVDVTGKNMQELIDCLLDYVTIDKIELNIISINIVDLVDEVKLELQKEIQSSGAKIFIHNLPKEIEADKVRLKQVFVNLFQNAIKFSKEGEKPIINVEGKENNDFFTISIADNGIGISPEFQHKIFNMFQRLNSNSKYKGNGIGLATCFKVVEMHHGEISVQSNEMGGCTFTFSIAKNII